MSKPRTRIRRAFLLVSIIALILTPLAASRGQQSLTPPADEQIEGIDVRYAKGMLRLAQAELRHATEMNKRIPGAFTAITIQRLKNNLAIAEAGLEQALNGDAHDPHEIHLREIEGHLKIAELNLYNAIQLNERMRGAIPESDVERLRQTVAVAQLALEWARDPHTTHSPQAHLQWQIDQLRQDVLRLQVRVEEFQTHR